VDVIDELERGHESYAERAWLDAYKSLSRADQASPLGAEDLELLATSAYMLGRDDEYLSCLERAHHAYLDSGEAVRAVRCAYRRAGLRPIPRLRLRPAEGSMSSERAVR
jgi:hypothetical protein